MSSPEAEFAAARRGDRVLEGKVAIVTGASRGIGAAAARAFAAAGATVVVAARDPEGLAPIVERLTAAGSEALAVPTDVGDPGAVERLVQRTLDAYGRVDAAFNNAGMGHRPRPLAELDVEEFDLAVRVNLRGVFLSLKYEVPAMLQSGGGAIVNMASTAGLRGVEGIAGYVAAKHGVIGLTRTTALDYGGRGIRVNALAPGPILSDRLAHLDERQREEIGAAVPQGRIGTVAEVAAAAVWLCSEQASFITGTTIPVDGGKLARGA